MKRDMDLIRKILFDLEKQSDGTPVYDLEIDGHSDKEVAYHCKLLYDAGYVLNYDASYADGDYLIGFGVGSISWDGHELIDTIRNDTVWNKTKDTVVKNGLSMTVDVIKEIATSILSGMTQAAIKGLTT
ncbi:MAG: hypothetical protein K0S18_124 [Anaerocolumna sp.]|nr:hypothetical protein [Anaerocolumna sp.]